jgi:cytochrome c-type biogenesis protein CcmE
MSRQRLKFTAGLLVVASAILVLVAVSIQGNMAYYVEVSDYLAKGPAAAGGNYRVRGNVVAGSIEKVPGRLGASFQMSDGAGSMRVRYDRELPDTFVDQAEVVVEGEMTPDGTFEAHTLLAKCPSKYEAAAAAGETHPEEVDLSPAGE